MWKRFLATLLALSLLAAACGEADTETTDETDETTTTQAAEEPAADEPMDEPMTTVVDIATGSDDFSTLVAALEAADLVEILQGDGPFTVLAPTNDAFDAAFAALGITAEELLADTATLTSILTYHVLPLEVDSATVVSLDGQTVETVNGQSVTVTVDGSSVMIDGATVTTPDVTADNGIVHVIDSVLLPPDVAAALGVDQMDSDEMDDEEMVDGTIVDVAVESGQFPTLVAALVATGLDEVLAGEGPFTVFAPTEEAFATALDALGITAEDLLADTELLTSILTYHVVAVDAPASVVVTLDGQDVETVNGATVAVSIDGDAVSVNDANVVTVDILGSNGVIHVIDAVLLPPSE